MTTNIWLRLRWLLGLWLLVIQTFASLATFAYDGKGQTAIAYDGNSKSLLRYDAVPVLATKTGSSLNIQQFG